MRHSDIVFLDFLKTEMGLLLRARWTSLVPANSWMSSLNIHGWFPFARGIDVTWLWPFVPLLVVLILPRSFTSSRLCPASLLYFGFLFALFCVNLNKSGVLWPAQITAWLVGREYYHHHNHHFSKINVTCGMQDTCHRVGNNPFYSFPGSPIAFSWVSKAFSPLIPWQEPHGGRHWPTGPNQLEDPATPLFFYDREHFSHFLCTSIFYSYFFRIPWWQTSS